MIAAGVETAHVKVPMIVGDDEEIGLGQFSLPFYKAPA